MILKPNLEFTVDRRFFTGHLYGDLAKTERLLYRVKPYLGLSMRCLSGDLLVVASGLIGRLAR